MVITYSKAILIQTIQTSLTRKNHFYVGVSKHKTIHIQLTFNQNQFSQTQFYQSILSAAKPNTHSIRRPQICLKNDSNLYSQVWFWLTNDVIHCISKFNCCKLSGLRENMIHVFLFFKALFQSLGEKWEEIKKSFTFVEKVFS